MQDFTIRIMPLTIALPKLSAEVYIVQGNNKAIIGNETLALETNGNRSSVYYQVTGAPGYGLLMIDYAPVSTFSQADVDAGRVAYFQHNMSTAIDAFELDVRDSARNEIRGVTVEVIVVPRVRTRDEPVAIDAGDGPFRITVDLLDAGELAELTGSDPVYRVIEAPRLGTISVSADTEQRRRREDVDVAPTWHRTRRRRRRRRNGEEEDDLESQFSDTKLEFSHDDVVNNRVAYTPRPDAAAPEHDDGPQDDGFNYILIAPNTQPARGSLKFEVILPPATEAPPVPDDDDEYYYVEVEEEEDHEKEYVTTALIVAGGAMTSICSIVSYRCYRLSRRRRWKRRQRELEALREDEKTESVERHAADLHPSEPLLTRSAWAEPMHVAASEAELRRIRAEHWQAERESSRRLNDALRCTAVDSPPPDERSQTEAGDQTLPGGSLLPRPQSRQTTQSPYSSSGGNDAAPQSARYDPVGGPPRSRTGDDAADTHASDRQPRPSPLSRFSESLAGPSSRNDAATTSQSDVQPTRTGKLLTWFDRPDGLPTSTDDRVAPESTDGFSRPGAARPSSASPGVPEDTANMERYPDDRQTHAVDRTGTQRQRPDRQSSEHSGVPSPGPIPGQSDQLRSLLGRERPGGDRLRAPAQARQRAGDDACADGSHCDDVVTRTAPTTTPSGTRSADDDVGYVTGSRSQSRPDDRTSDGDHDEAAGSASTAQHIVYDWDKVDPQLLDLCRKTSPVLDKNQYWV